MSFSVLGATVAMIAKDLGIHNAAVNDAVNALRLIGDVVRSVNAIHILYNEALTITNALQAESVTAEEAMAVAAMENLGITEAETAANYGLAASLEAVDAAMGPVGWLALAGGIGVGAGVLGFGLAGGFGGGGGGTAPGLASALANPTITINIQNADFSSHKTAKEAVNNIGNLVYAQNRSYGH